MKIFSNGKQLGKKALIEQIKIRKIAVEMKFEEKDSIISQRIIKRILEFFRLCISHSPDKDYRKITGHLIFIFSKDFSQIFHHFDLSFIAVLCLIKLRLPKLKIVLKFYGPNKLSAAPKSFFQFCQFRLTSSSSLSEQIFSIEYNETPIDYSQKNISYFLVSSADYLPLLYINESEFSLYFQSDFSAIWKDVTNNIFPAKDIEGHFKSIRSSSMPFREKIYQSMRSHIIAIAISDFKAKKDVHFDRLSCILSFMHCLRKIGCIHLLLTNNIKDFTNKNILDNLHGKHGLGISGFKNVDDRNYEKEMAKRISILYNSSPYFVLLFCILIENTDVFSFSSSNNISAVISIIDKNLRFAAQIFDGLKELSKNILDHSTEKRGFLSLRLYKRNALFEIKSEHLKSYISERAEVDEFIDFVLIDDSAKGILSQTLNKLIKMREQFTIPYEASLIDKDINRLSTKEVTLKDFFIIDNYSLLHQEIRSAASLGLLIFSDFLIKNDGVVFISSVNKSNPLCSIISEGFKDNIISKDAMPFGTYYNAMLPIKDSLDRIVHPTFMPFESISATDAYEELTNIELLKLDEYKRGVPIDCSGKYKCIKCMKASMSDLPNLIETIINSKLDKCEKCVFRSEMILALNLNPDSIDADPSDVFRILSQIQRNEGSKGIIIYNMKEQSLYRLINILKIYGDVTKRMWSKRQLVLIYYIPKHDFHGTKKYYTWLIGGDTFSDMLIVNMKILYSNDGYMLYYDDKIFNDINMSDLKFYYDNPLFAKNGHLLPFDAILKESEYTLFEWNVLDALQTPIKEDSSVKL